MNKLFIVACITLLASTSSYGQSTDNSSSFALKEFFSPIPKPTVQPAEAATPPTPSTTTAWRPVVTIPGIKIVESKRDNAKLDAFILSQVGGGISWQKLKFDSADNKWKSEFTWSPLTLLISGDTTKDQALDISYAMTVGWFDNLIMVGAGYDLGDVKDRSRLFGLISIGINFNN